MDTRRPCCLLVLFLMSLVGADAQAQTLGELTYEELPTEIMTDDRDAAVLVVETTVTPLFFESRRGIREVRDTEIGVYQILLTPGVHHVEVRAEGYLLLKLPRWNFPPKSGRSIRVRAKPQFGAADVLDSERPELRLDYAVDAGEDVHVQLDANPPQRWDFSGGSVTLRPTPGTHTVKVFSGGRVWKRTMELERGETYREAVTMSEGTAVALSARLGNLFIESVPPGATVYLNQVEQTGVTPLILNDLQPGTYQVEVVLAQHLPVSQQREIHELAFTSVEVKLIPNYGQVEFTSDPSGALVYINDEQRGTTPFSARLDAGLHPLRLVQSLYHDLHDTLRIEPGTEIDDTYKMRPHFGTVDVSSEPTGAQVLVKGISWGVTPLRQDSVLSGRYIVQVVLDPYPPQEHTVQVRDSEVHDEFFDLRSSVGHLTAFSTPPGAAVVLKESRSELGYTPLHGVPLRPGVYTLAFNLPNHDEAERTVPMVQGEALELRVTLTPHVGHVQVETTPPRARILLDGEVRGVTPQVLRDVPTGRYTLRLEKEGHDPNVSQITVERGMVTDHRVTLGTTGTEAWRARRARALKLAVLPGLGQLGSPAQTWRGFLYLAGSVAAGLLAIDAHRAYDQAEQIRRGELAAYRSALRQATMDRHYDGARHARDDMDSAKRRFNMSLAAVGALYGAQWLDALVFGGGRLEAHTRRVSTRPPLVAQPLMAASGLEVRWWF